MTTLHTPGPWEMSADAVPDWVTQISIYATDLAGTRVAQVFETEANAHLIAAAPDMLMALKALVATHEYRWGPATDACGGCEGCAGRAAIDKAEGTRR